MKKRGGKSWLEKTIERVYVLWSHCLSWFPFCTLNISLFQSFISFLFIKESCLVFSTQSFRDNNLQPEEESRISSMSAKFHVFSMLLHSLTLDRFNKSLYLSASLFTRIEPEKEEGFIHRVKCIVLNSFPLQCIPSIRPLLYRHSPLQGRRGREGCTTKPGRRRRGSKKGKCTSNKLLGKTREDGEDDGQKGEWIKGWREWEPVVVSSLNFPHVQHSFTCSFSFYLQSVLWC